jgi:RimJ/RimL family protein N-acetyltransferase
MPIQRSVICGVRRLERLRQNGKAAAAKERAPAILRDHSGPPCSRPSWRPTCSPPSMSAAVELRTERLLLRQWREEDKGPFAALNADPLVMRYFASTQSRAQSDRSIAVWAQELDERGWSNWAVEHLTDGRFMGFVGLTIPRRALPFMPCVEIGYRLARKHWGNGFATEAGREVLRFAFDVLGLLEVVSFTSKLNLPSQAVMQRLGMSDVHEDFEHPALPEGSPLRLHVLYRLARGRWAEQRAAKVGLPAG